MSLELQGKLLFALEQGQFRSIGSTIPSESNVRVICTSTQNIDMLTQKGIIRSELAFRLTSLAINLPPLRERKEDIPLLVQHFIDRFNVLQGRRLKKCSERVLAAFMKYPFPGNIRELKSIIKSAVNLSQGRKISKIFLPDNIQKQKKKPKHQPGTTPVVSLAQMEKSYILDVYNQTGKNKSQTARLLDIALNTLRKKLKIYGVK